MTSNPDPPIKQFERELRNLIRASEKSYRKIASLVPCSATAVADAVSGEPRRIPGPRIVEGICNVCGADERTLAQLLELRAKVVESRPDPAQPDPAQPDPAQPDPAQPDPAQPDPAQPDPAQPDPAQPDPAQPDPAQPDPAQWRQWWGYKTIRFGSLVTVVLVVIALVIVWIIDRDSCRGHWVLRSGQFNECVGVTDGDNVFSPALGLQAVMVRIKRENDSVMNSGSPYVSIGYVVPLPRDPKSGLLTALRHELEGAYLAQWRANHHSGLGDTPLVRLLIDNVGDQAEQWDKVIPEVIDRVNPVDHLVAVAGLGQSLDTTKRAIQELSRPPQQPGWEEVSKSGIPMIASRLTADDLSTIPGQPVRGLFRIPATNSAETAIAARVLKTQSALLVEDINQDDAYTNSLAEQFQAEFTTPSTTGRLLEPERYDSSLPGVDNTFLTMMYSICVKKPSAIYFAGRGVNLPGFLGALASRPCPELKIDLFTGDDGVDLTAALREQLNAGNQNGIAANLHANITLHYTGLAHPGEWSDSQRFQEAAIGIFQQNCVAAACFVRLFPEDRLDDGAAIVGYDALLVATHAIRSGLSQQGAPVDAAAITPGVVLQQLYRINETAPVYGASGPIGFDGQGRPINKPIPVLQLNADGTVTFTRIG